MNRFVHKKSNIGVLFIYCCVLALFTDAINFTDLFPDFSTIHFEEVNETGLYTEAGSLATIAPPSFNLFNLLQPIRFAAKPPSTIKRILFDQDSPSLEAISISHSITSFIFPEEKRIPTHRAFLRDSLYLQYCSLLI
jgi:hypothetical protein